MATKEEIAAFLEQHVRFAYPYAFGYRLGRPQPPSVEEFAHQLLEIAGFRALRLGSWLGTTDGQAITEAVEMVTPPLYCQDVEFLVAALRYAAEVQHTEGQRKAGQFALVGVVIAAVMFLATMSAARSA